MVEGPIFLHPDDDVLDVVQSGTEGGGLRKSGARGRRQRGECGSTAE